MTSDLLNYLKTRYFNTLQSAFAEMVRRRSDINATNDGDALELLAALTLRVTSEGHSCLDIDEWSKLYLEALKAKETPEKSTHAIPAADIANWIDEWKKQCLSLNTNAFSTPANPQKLAPLVLDNTDNRKLVFLKRFHDYEINIATRLQERIKILQTQDTQIDECQLKIDIKNANKNFAQRDFDQDNQQKAIFNTLQTPFSVITGGPGRGKTTVLAEILALELKNDPSLTIALCAPTGKAAARMKQAVENALKYTLDTKILGENVIQKLSDIKPKTVHSLIGITQDTDYPKVNATNPLPFDLVAVDECSMLSLQMFSQLLSALNKNTKLILLGDENQLESVDSGEVLAALCKSLPKNCVNRLTENFRSQANKPLCNYTDKLVEQETPNMTCEVDSLYTDNTLAANQGLFLGIEITDANQKYSGEIHGIKVGNTAKNHLENVITGFLKIANAFPDPNDPEKTLDNLLNDLEKYKILSPVYEGTYGVDNLNAVVKHLLGKKSEYDNGVPILVTKNDKVTGLFNGDIGVCKAGKVHFKTLDSTGKEVIKSFSPAQLPEHNCAYAMSIHKSQGSDYENVLMVLPPKKNFFLSKKLIYTGMTRTKKNFILLSDKETLATSQLRNEKRWSLLALRIQNAISQPTNSSISMRQTDCRISPASSLTDSQLN